MGDGAQVFRRRMKTRADQARESGVLESRGEQENDFAWRPCYRRG